MKNRSKQFIGKIMGYADFPPVALGVESRMEINGSRSVNIEGCDGILEYDSDKIVMRLSDGVVTVNGEALELSRYGEKYIVINGKIKGVTLAGG